MKFKVMRSDFLRELQRVQSISPTVEKSNPPILSHVKITTVDGALELFATNLGIGYKSVVPSTVSVEGSMTLETRKAFEIFRELTPDGEVEVDEGTKGWAVISVPGVVFRVGTMPSDEFPAAPQHTEGGFNTVEAGILRDMIARTDFAISSDEAMRTLSGALLHTGDGDLVMVATDGHRMAKIVKSGRGEADITDTIIPRRAVAEIKKLTEEIEDDEQIQIKTEKDHLILKKGDTIFYCRLIKGTFPDYNQVVPSEFNRHMVIDREKFYRALRRVSILSNERSKPVILAITGGEMELRSNSPEMGEAKESIEVDAEGEEMEIGFNARYLLEALGAIEEEKVIFDIIDGANASVLRGEGNDEYLCVVMPMRV
jgi:DNA polymerase-3 subunit beta